jgi:WD40 repeat protein
VAFSPNGAHIVSGSRDKTVQIWDSMMGAEVTRMEGHSDFVYSVAFSPNGTRVVSTSGDRTVRIWEVTVGTEVTGMKGHSDRVSSVAFSPDSMRVLSGSDDYTVRILRLSQFWIFRDGWVVQCGHPHIRLFWYPAELQHTLFPPRWPHWPRRISNMSQTHLEFHTHTLGTDWQQIYHSPHPTSLFGMLA